MKATLLNAQQGYQAIQASWQEFAKPMLIAGHRLTLEIKEATRSEEQNAKFHALCGDVAKSGAKWMGKTRTQDEWKVLFISGHAVATGGHCEVVGGLEGELVNIRESSAQMSVKRSSSLIDYASAWCAMNDIRLPALEYA